jgi:hypothetical protein
MKTDRDGEKDEEPVDFEVSKPTSLVPFDPLQRYLHTFPNLILTNFLEFRLYRNGTLIDKVMIGRPFVLHQLQTVPPVEHEAEFLTLLEKFFCFFSSLKFMMPNR